MPIRECNLKEKRSLPKILKTESRKTEYVMTVDVKRLGRKILPLHWNSFAEGQFHWLKTKNKLVSKYIHTHACLYACVNVSWCAK